jgi:hypothetical protein
VKYRLRPLFCIMLVAIIFGCSSSEEKEQPQVGQRSHASLIAEKLQAYEAVKTIPRVLQGYKSIYHHWPRSIKDFDNGEFFFDSGYLADSISKGFTVYLALTDDVSGFKIWSFPERSKSAYQLAADGVSLIETDAAEMRSELDSGYRIEAQKGELFFLLAKNLSIQSK